MAVPSSSFVGSARPRPKGKPASTSSPTTARACFARSERSPSSRACSVGRPAVRRYLLPRHSVGRCASLCRASPCSSACSRCSESACSCEIRSAEIWNPVTRACRRAMSELRLVATSKRRRMSRDHSTSSSSDAPRNLANFSASSGSSGHGSRRLAKTAACVMLLPRNLSQRPTWILPSSASKARLREAAPRCMLPFFIFYFSWP